MKLQHLSIVNYKNIHSGEFDFSHKINCFVGDNGMGKTNVLDAIYYLSFCKSPTNPVDAQVINYEEDFFVLQGFYNCGGKEENIYCGMKRKQKKQFKRNKNSYARYSEHIGLLPLVMVSPGDVDLIHLGGEERRLFLNAVISQYDKTYLQMLIRYNNALQNRNKLLKSALEDELMFDIYEDELVEYGAYIYNKRKEFIQDLLPIFQKYYSFISEEKERVQMEYISHLQSDENLKTLLQQTRERDKIIGFTTKGIHRDDIEMQLNSYSLKRTGSQGQIKTYLIALKLAQFELLKKVNQKTPLLLLDDIFAKLDANRVKQIIKLVSSDAFGQIFITDTNREHVDEMLKLINQEYKLFSVKNGEIIEVL
jgi:DNA replication and repair protein RecF